jgi:hypothetical protein
MLQIREAKSPSCGRHETFACPLKRGLTAGGHISILSRPALNGTNLAIVIGLRLFLVVDALALLLASRISDPIVGDVALFPAVLVGVIAAIACLSADVVKPRRRVEWICSSLSIIAPLVFVALPGPFGHGPGAAAIIALQVIPLVRVRRAPGRGRSIHRVVAALVITTTVLLIAVVALVWYGANYLLRPPASAFTRGPFLTLVTTSRADIAWQMAAGQPNPIVTIISPDGTTTASRSGRFTGLLPATRYVWTANVAGHSAAAGSFDTAPLTTSTPITLVSFGDYGSGNAHEYAVGGLAAAQDPDLFLSTGDNAYLLAAPPFLNRAIFDPLRSLLGEAPAVVALGEHDLAYDDGSAVIEALHLPGHHYVAQYGPVQIVVLGLQADASALVYARDTLGRCRPACPVRFVLTHRPIGTDNPIMPLLRERQVAAILAGHLHRYERHERAGILQFTLGTGGEGPGSAGYTQPTPDAKVSFLAYGFLRIDIHNGTIDYRFIDQRGHIRDHVTRTIPRAP